MNNNPSVSRKSNRLWSILTEKCPKCREGRVFEKKKQLLGFPEMKTKCDICGYMFDREPGYFLGAMYVSYGLAVLEGLLTFLVCHILFPDMATIWIPVAILGVITLLAYKNYKLSRIIYIHIFPW